MFDAARFTEDCLQAVNEADDHIAVKEIVTRAMTNPADIVAGLGQPTRAGVNKIHVSDRLTILNLVWGPMMTLMPHNHNMWAVIGIYGGREDNIFWRRIKDDTHGRIEAAGAEALSTGDVAPLGKDIIHSVTNPINKLTGALHVYGGNFFEEHRSEWEAESLTETTYDVEKNLALFEQANAHLAAAE